MSDSDLLYVLFIIPIFIILAVLEFYCRRAEVNCIVDERERRQRQRNAANQPSNIPRMEPRMNATNVTYDYYSRRNNVPTYTNPPRRDNLVLDPEDLLSSSRIPPPIFSLNSNYNTQSNSILTNETDRNPTPQSPPPMYDFNANTNFNRQSRSVAILTSEINRNSPINNTPPPVYDGNTNYCINTYLTVQSIQDEMNEARNARQQTLRLPQNPPLRYDPDIDYSIRNLPNYDEAIVFSKTTK